jgi:hypothetical protein
MRNICILRDGVTPRLQKAVSTEARHIRHISSKNYRPTRQISRIICIHIRTRLHTHIETVCPDGENVFHLAVFTAGDLISERSAGGYVEVGYDLTIPAGTVKR